MTKFYVPMGQTIMMKHKSGNTEAYPWNGIAVPVEIIAEYPNFYLGIVKKHNAPYMFGPSIPYRITVSKHDLQIGELIIEEV